MTRKKRENISQIKERILYFIEYLGVKREEFYKKTTINGANFRGTSAMSDLSGEKIAKILRAYPMLNPDWLLLGDGDMVRNVTSDVDSIAPQIDDIKQQLLDYRDYIRLLKDKVQMLESSLEEERKKVSLLQEETSMESTLR